ncbi:MAG: dienelactone hydrolase family protein [Humibacillus sp.]|nr:dienelactone hydrolase family protein [Humibacillus sp.]
MSLLAGWHRSSHTSGRFTFDTYRRGTGPGVILMHESPGLTPEVTAFGHDLTREGYTVVMPHFFGSAQHAPRRREALGLIAQVCIRREFTLLATGRTTPVAGWLRSLAAGLHAELGGAGVGAIGMCFTGGFALAMMLDPSVVAPVVAQPAIPLATDRGRAADVNLSAADLAAVRARVQSGCPVLGVRYRDDRSTGTRFETLTRELGDGFRRVELDGPGHATLTAERHPVAVDAVLDFLRERLAPPDRMPPG